MMKLMNSDTHSCTVSFASFDILAFAGRDFFMILLTFAIGRNRSCSFVELSEMLPEVGLPTGLPAVAGEFGFRFWTLMAEGFGRNLVAEGRIPVGIGGGGKWVCGGDYIKGRREWKFQLRGEAV